MKNSVQYIVEYVRQHGFNCYPILNQNGVIDKEAYAIVGQQNATELVRCADELKGMIMPFLLEKDKKAVRIQTNSSADAESKKNMVGIFVRADE